MNRRQCTAAFGKSADNHSAGVRQPTDARIGTGVRREDATQIGRGLIAIAWTDQKDADHRPEPRLRPEGGNKIASLQMLAVHVGVSGRIPDIDLATPVANPAATSMRIMSHDGIDQYDVRPRPAADLCALRDTGSIEENGCIGRIGKEPALGDGKGHVLTSPAAAMHDRRRLSRHVDLGAGSHVDPGAQFFAVIEAA